MSRAITTLRTAPGGKHNRSSSGAGGLKASPPGEEEEEEATAAAQGPVAEWRQSPAGAPQTGQPRGRVAGSLERGVLTSVGDELKSDDGAALEEELEEGETDPHAAASQSTAGAPKV